MHTDERGVQILHASVIFEPCDIHSMILGLCVALPSQPETRRGASESGSPERGGDTWGPAGSAEDASHDAGRVRM